MNILAVLFIVASSVGTSVAQTIELGYPTDGVVFRAGETFQAQVMLPYSMASCIDVGIALAIDSCPNGLCPQPSTELGSVLYAGPWNPTVLAEGRGFYQNFTVQVPAYMTTGSAIFTLTHLCLLGAGPAPFLEYRNVSISIA
ncbi:hypothetical protein EDC04DRAFT_1509270 [Pisolithus marmoratus]|nr:hypothetical protein EDC04DRAFT_1509270 [Pisolithus marmoratus]